MENLKHGDICCVGGRDRTLCVSVNRVQNQTNEMACAECVEGKPYCRLTRSTSELPTWSAGRWTRKLEQLLERIADPARAEANQREMSHRGLPIGSTAPCQEGTDQYVLDLIAKQREVREPHARKGLTKGPHLQSICTFCTVLKPTSGRTISAAEAKMALMPPCLGRPRPKASAGTRDGHVQFSSANRAERRGGKEIPRERTHPHLQFSDLPVKIPESVGHFSFRRHTHTHAGIAICFAARLSITITHSVSSVVCPLFRCCTALALRKGPAAAAAAADR